MKNKFQLRNLVSMGFLALCLSVMVSDTALAAAKEGLPRRRSGAGTRVRQEHIIQDKSIVFPN